MSPLAHLMQPLVVGYSDSCPKARNPKSTCIMPQTWFSADSHYGHKNIIRYCDRPFDSTDEMDRALIATWNEVVEPEDTVYFLGDFSLDFKRVRQVVPLLNGNIHLVAGNHDLCHSCNGAGSAYIQRYLDAGFASVCETVDLQIAGETILCHHMPYYDPSDEDQRYPEFKPIDEGGWLLHGHVHQRWKMREKQINVGVDVWDFYPVSISELAEIISGRAPDQD